MAHKIGHGVSGTTNQGYGQNGSLKDILSITSGSADSADKAMAFANQFAPLAPKADPWEAAFQFFAEMGRQASVPGSTALGAAVGSLQAPMDYLTAKKKELRDSEAARTQMALTVGAGLKKPKEEYIQAVIDDTAGLYTSTEIEAAKADGKTVTIYEKPLAPKVNTAFETLKARAKAAGYEEGTPEYKEFMRTGGKESSKGFTITTDTDGNVTVTQGGNGETGKVPAGFLRKTDEETGATVDYVIEGSEQAVEVQEKSNVFNAKIDTGLDMIRTVESIVGRPAGDGLTALPADPALPTILGNVQGRLPPRTQAQANLLVKIEQIQGEAFLQAFATLKGGGQITEIEGKKATQAIARLSRIQDPEEFSKALFEFVEIVRRGIRNNQAGLAALPIVTTAPPKIENADIPESFLTSEQIIKITKDAGITLEQLWNKMTEEQRLKYGQ